MVDLNSSSSNLLKVIFFIHFILATWGVQGSWSPSSYFFYNAFLFILLIWGLHHRDSEDPIQMALLINVVSILLDIIVLSVYYPSYLVTPGSERFSVGMAIINLLLRPVTSVFLYRNLQDRAGLDGPAFPANFGNFFGAPAQRSPYEDIDRPHTMPPPAAPEAPRTSGSPAEKPYYNIVG